MGPDLADGELWPRNARGIPLTFLAQIDGSSLPQLNPAWPDPHPWAHGGELIRVFADLLDNPVEPGPAIVLACRPSGPLVRSEAPPIPDPWSPGGPWEDGEAEDRFHVLPPSWGADFAPDPALADEDAWRVLLALHFDERIDLQIHDVGAIHVLAPVADLAAGRYDRTVCSVASG